MNSELNSTLDYVSKCIKTNSKFKNTLDFINKAILQEQGEYRYLFAFLRQYEELHKKTKAKLPYHINVIDELHANENAHSRILVKLLQQKTPHSRFDILESFIEYLIEQKSALFSNIKIEKPTITQETERIDLWIRDKTYALIIENKIHYAGDQERQLERYIDKTKENGFRNEQIFVVYLSPRREEPDAQSWGKYKDEFQKRYLNLSFNHDIILWLKEKVLPDVKLKDVFLRSAIEQYIDHLEGIFSIRTINNKMNMELQEFIKQELGLNGTPIENIAKLLAKQEEINRVNDQIQLLINEITKEADKSFFRERQKEMSVWFPDYQSVYEEGTRAGLVVPVDNKTSVRVSISFDSKLYCQIDMDIFDNQTLPESVEEKTKHLLPLKNNNNQIWKYFDRYDYDGVFRCFHEVVKILTQ
ncbi:MAG: PD-(D/E)XK nuclease family protein [Paludibacter sp.]|nr:PD-(D/E)XK nuclease family protein [Paludibacter sp.]